MLLQVSIRCGGPRSLVRIGETSGRAGCGIDDRVGECFGHSARAPVAVMQPVAVPRIDDAIEGDVLHEVPTPHYVVAPEYVDRVARGFGGGFDQINHSLADFLRIGRCK